MAPLVAGIDPGLTGAIAVIDDAGEVAVFDMPTLALARGGKSKREIDAHGLVDILSQRISHCFVEQVNSMPGQGVSSVFAFGKAYGLVLGILAATRTPMTLVTPRVWKAATRTPSAKDGARARARASQVLPQAAHLWPLRKHDGRAEAALLAHYGLRQLKSGRSDDDRDDAERTSARVGQKTRPGR
jgi:crossover junction endodeoxyribonuclease RuvC